VCGEGDADVWRVAKERHKCAEQILQVCAKCVPNRSCNVTNQVNVNPA
jgi:hypothetical protein